MSCVSESWPTGCGSIPRTIRYYERIGLLPDPDRTGANYRIYAPGDADRLAFIKTAQRLGLSLDEIREILAFRDRGEAPCGYVRQVLRRQVDTVDDRIAELRALRRELVSLEAQGRPAATGARRLLSADRPSRCGSGGGQPLTRRWTATKDRPPARSVPVPVRLDLPPSGRCSLVGSPVWCRRDTGGGVPRWACGTGSCTD